MDIMSPAHPRWEDFCERLAGPEGCNFLENATWHCGGGTDKSKSAAILETMGGFDVESSLKFFEEHGGYCDCEVLFQLAS